MFPTLPIDDSERLTLTDAEFGADCFRRETSRQRQNLHHVAGQDFARAVLRSPARLTALLSVHVANVLPLRPIPKMRRVYASRVVAAVATHRLGPVPMRQKERDTMSLPNLAIEPERPVPVVLLNIRQPRPAFALASHRNLAPKPLHRALSMSPKTRLSSGIRGGGA